MNSATPPLLKPRRRYGLWVLLGLSMMIAPIVVVGVGVVSMLTLSRDAALLRREVMASTNSGWDTKVQMSVGRVTLGLVRTGLQFVRAEHMDDARLALKAVGYASVGVYEREGRLGELSVEQLFLRTDEKMKSRGWTRLVGVAEADQTVLVYSSEKIDSGGRMDLCLAVVDGNTLVVVSTKVDPAVLGELAGRHMPKEGFREKLKHARL